MRLVTARPELLADHAEAYAELFASELGSAGDSLKRQVVLNSLAVCGLGVGVVLAGVALMLWAVLPMAQSQAPWALMVVPVLPLVMAGACFFAASRYAKLKPFSHIRRQMAADLAMVREVGAT